MGFKATEVVEELTYDFNPHVQESGTIPEPSSAQIESFRKRIFGAVKDSGIDPSQVQGLAQGQVQANFSFDKMDELLEKANGIEEAMVQAVADLTGISQATLNALPFRIKAAFMGWITGEFLNPEG